MGVVVVPAFARDIQKTPSGRFPAELVVRVLETGHAYELFWADIQVQVEEPFELADSEEVAAGQLGDGDPGVGQDLVGEIARILPRDSPVCVDKGRKRGMQREFTIYDPIRHGIKIRNPP